MSSSLGTTQCDLLGARLDALLDGALSEADRERADAHLAECPRCAALLAHRRALRARLARLAVTERAPASLHERVRRALGGPPGDPPLAD